MERSTIATAELGHVRKTVAQFARLQKRLAVLRCVLWSYGIWRCHERGD